MCVKTKTEWSCGCYKKAFSPCDDAPSSRIPCSQVDKYRYLDDGDCKDCQADGAYVSGGQDGPSRYACETEARGKMSKWRSTRAVLGEVSGNGSWAGLANNGKAPVPIVIPDPWMKPTRREKEWESPSRRHADEEWEREHARRKADIESLAQAHSASPKRKFHSRRMTAPAGCSLPYEVEQSLVLHHQRRHSGSEKQISHTMSYSDPLRQSRQGSFESIESVPSRGRSRTLPFQYGYATGFDYAVEDRAPRDAYDGVYNSSPVVYRRR